MSESPARPFTDRIKTFMPRTSPLNTSQKQGMREFSPLMQLTMAQGVVSPEAVFGRRAPLTVEIGFGMGQTLIAMAQAAPERDFIGIEIHKPGVAQLCFDAGTQGVHNLRYFSDDAVQILEQAIAPGSVDTVQLFFPDPWQKARHHKRRFVRPDLIALVRRTLAIGGRFHMATDWEPYAHWMLEHMEAAPGFSNAHAPGEYMPRPAWRPLTKFEQRGHDQGHGVWDLIYVRVD